MSTNAPSVVQAKGPFPLMEHIIKALEMIDKPELIGYTGERWKQILDKAGQPFKEQFKEGRVFYPIQKLVDDFLTLRDAELKKSGDVWKGKTSTEYQNLKFYIGDQAVKMLSGQDLDQVLINFKINPKGLLDIMPTQLDGKPIDPLLAESLSAVTGAYLTDQNLVLVDGKLFETDDNGNIQKDENNKNKERPQTREEYDKLAKGFDAFLKGRGIQTNPVEVKKSRVAAEVEKIEAKQQASSGAGGRR